MRSTKDKYKQYIEEACNHIHADKFPQIDTYEFMCRNLTLCDVFVTPKVVDDTESSSDKKVFNYGTRNRVFYIESPSGKSTFIKRLSYALVNHQTEYLSQPYIDCLNPLLKNDIPILFDCRNLNDLHDLNSAEYTRILYKLLANPDKASQFLTEDELAQFIESNLERMILIVDNLDSISDTSKKNNFLLWLKSFIYIDSRIDVIITGSYKLCSSIDSLITHHCYLGYDRLFALDYLKKYSSLQPDIDYSPLYNRTEECDPLSLTSEIIIHKNGQRSTNQYTQLTEKYIKCKLNLTKEKYSRIISNKSITILLSYIAVEYVNEDQRWFTPDDLLSIIQRALNDCKESFSEDLSTVDIKSILQDLMNTGVFIQPEPARFNYYVMNSLFLRYFYAKGILVRYCDKTTQSKKIADIFEDSYLANTYKESIFLLCESKQTLISLINAIKRSPYYDKDYLYQLLSARNETNKRLLEFADCADFLDYSESLKKAKENNTLELKSIICETLDKFGIRNDSKGIDDIGCNYILSMNDHIRQFYPYIDTTPIIRELEADVIKNESFRSLVSLIYLWALGDYAFRIEDLYYPDEICDYMDSFNSNDQDIIWFHKDLTDYLS